MMRRFFVISCAFTLSLLLMACSDDTETTNNSEGSETVLVSAPAELVSLQEISLTPPNIRRMWEYKIEYLARENSLVKEGDLLMKFDGQRLRTDMVSRQSEYDAAIKEAEQKKLENEAKLEELVLDLAEAKKNMDIAKRKVEITDVSRSEIERKKQQAEFKITTALNKQAKQRVDQHTEAMKVNEQVQQAKIAKAKSRVDEMRQSLAKLQVKAPKDGMVVLVPNNDDDKPAIGDTVFMGARIINLPSLDKIAVKVEFDESFTPDVQLGDQVRVTLDAFPERPFTGVISELGKSYRNKSQNNLKVVFDAWVKLDELDLNIMRPGMKATVDLIESAS
ncbi:HlyD family secretion protein [Glaciecola petra]|uniref:Efflux RND transporter periplasmic adaptor subunit n=1 Tax=Glaciecola petra TaxID=3075602 RepID=A0ABU2ZW67_9ALTE|nr:efflux RND transporter periplasmic adaptor subunit [Aestuariibacter sp. P117]MDT0596660.1 efflux RND transporter periplasmic adaptor subunit [Aestuariibacter sp. P117]